MRRDARPSRSARSSALVVALCALGGLFTLAAAGTLGGCSLVSGWSDLQTATKDAARPGATDSGGTSGSNGDGDSGDGTSGGDGSSGSSGDSGTSGDGGNTTPPVVCGAGTCAAGEGCCVSFSGTKTCGLPAACETGSGSMFFACTSSTQCDSRAPICCYDFGAESAACAGACGSGGNSILCDAPPNTCPQGKSCTGHNTGVPSVRTCQ